MNGTKPDNYYYTHDGRRVRKFDYQTVNGEMVAIPTKEWRALQEQTAMGRRLKQAGLSPETLNFTFDTYIGKDKPNNIPKLKEYVEGFFGYHQYHHLYLYSDKNGTQKTTMASVVAGNLLALDWDVHFVLMHRLVETLQNAQFDEAKTAYQQKLENADLLVVDDSFDPRKVTVYRSGYQIPFLDMFLRQRLEVTRKATVFTSNFAPSTIDEKTFGRSLRSLIERNCAALYFDDHYSLKADFDPNNIWSS